MASASWLIELTAVINILFTGIASTTNISIGMEGGGGKVVG